jgi:hypothetical protein
MDYQVISIIRSYNPSIIQLESPNDYFYVTWRTVILHKSRFGWIDKVNFTVNEIDENQARVPHSW